MVFVRNVIWIVTALFSTLTLASAPHVDLKGIVRSLDSTTVVLETHGQELEVPRAAFEDQETLEVGGSAKARLELSDLKKVKSAKR